MFKYKLIIATLIILIVVGIGVSIKVFSAPDYVGSEVELSKADNNTLFQLNNAALSISPEPQPGVQSDIKIIKFAENYAQGTISYSDKSPAQHFMAVKLDNSWKIIANNSGKSLILPNVETAKELNLPKGWYEV